MPKKSVKEGSNNSPEQLALQGIAYVETKNHIKELDNQCKELRKPLEAFLEANAKTMPSGSRVVVLTHADQDVTLKHTLKVSATLVPEAEEILRKSGITEPLETVTVVREDVIERLHKEGAISDALLKELYVTKDTYAFSVGLSKHYEEQA